jgi:dipeptidyl aminopeptidase/acylaminoacyl peptidase
LRTKSVWTICGIFLTFAIIPGAPGPVSAQGQAQPQTQTSGQASAAPQTAPAARPAGPSGQTQQLEGVENEIEAALWRLRVGDVAEIDQFEIASSKPIRMPNPTGQGAGNPLILYLYTFTPKKLAAGQKAPLIVFNHDGIHSHFNMPYVHIVRELMDLGYVVVAPEYRGSTGYGEEYYSQIDYGGAEVDDVHDVRNWAVANLPHVDPERVGIMGWSHGGYITLMNIFRWPHDYKVAYAGCPVSDLVMRMGYKAQAYRDLYAGFIGKQAEDDPMEYRKRSPVFYADKLDTPLLVHSNTNDEDVNVMEVQHLIEAFKAAGKTFELKIYDNAPGGHSFNRLDTALARQSRQEIYAFLAKYLKP